MVGRLASSVEIKFWQVVEWLFPARCVSCSGLGDWWCLWCDGDVVAISNPTCPRCRKLTAAGRYCPRCRPHVQLTGILAGAHLREPLPAAIKALKYRSATVLVTSLARYQIIALARLPRLKGAVLVPVPLHPKRQRSRGYNQAALLATTVSRATSLPLLAALRRTKPTASQTGLNRKQRLQNVAGAFRWADQSAPATVILVDDVSTTGATLNAAAKACRDAGARQVWGLVVAQR